MRLYLDSNAIIYAHEGPPELQAVVAGRVVEACVSSSGVVMTSLLARLEVRAKPLRMQNQRLLDHYEFLFNQSGLLILSISPAVIERATSLRSAHGFRTPDAIHLATALEAQAEVFLTGDKALAKCPGLHVELLSITQ